MVGIHKTKKSGCRRVKRQRLLKRQLQKSTLEMIVAWTRVEVVERGRIQTQKGLRDFPGSLAVKNPLPMQGTQV